MTYISPLNSLPLPGGLSLTQFIQTVLVGVSELPGPLVRPEWQKENPKQPDINWLAFGIQLSHPDANAYQVINQDGNTVNQRTETVEVTCSVYGPNALENYGLIRDGLQISQNLTALYLAKMAFVEVTDGRRMPDLVNELWIDRVVTSIIFRRLVQRTYGALSILSVSGKIYVPDLSADYFLNFSAAS